MNVFLWPFIAMGAGGLWTAYRIAPERLYEALLAFAKRSAQLRPKTRQVGEDEIFYMEGGHLDDRPPLMLLHDLSADWVSWLPCLRFLTRRYRVIVPDLPGFGESSRRGEASYDVASQRDRMLRFVDSLGLEQVHLVGSSMGGQLAAAMALADERVKTLTMLAPMGVQSPEPSDVELMLSTMGADAMVPRTVEGFEALFAMNFVQQPPVPSKFRRCYIERLLRHQGFLEKVWRELADEPFDLTYRLHHLRQPTLLVWGTSDRVVDPSAAKIFLERIPDCALVHLQDCGHAPQAEQPERFTRRLFEFLDEFD